MALADILAAMEAQVAAAIEQDEREATAEAERLRAAAVDEAAASRAARLAEARVPLARERARRLNAARRDALAAIGRAREGCYAAALAATRARLAALRDTPAYPAILDALAREALAQLDGETIIHADPRDRALLDDLFLPAPIIADLTTWGGIIARTADGRIVVTNTLEARLEAADRDLRGAIMPLFAHEAGPEGEGWATTATPMRASAR